MPSFHRVIHKDGTLGDVVRCETDPCSKHFDDIQADDIDSAKRMLEHDVSRVYADGFSPMRKTNNSTDGITLGTTDDRNGEVMDNNHNESDDGNADMKTNEDNDTSITENDTHTITDTAGTVPMNHRGDNSWVDEAKADLPRWRNLVPVDSLGEPIDWDYIGGLDLRNGVGVGADYPDPIEGARIDTDIQLKLHAAYETMNRAFTYGDGYTIKSYRYARAIAYANRRLSDELETLNARAEELGSEPTQGRKDELVDAWTKRKNSIEDKRKREEKKTMTPEEREAAENEPKPSLYWLPGRDVSTVVGGDLETTSLYPDTGYIINYGTETTDVNPVTGSMYTSVSNEADEHPYDKDYYRNDGSYHDISVTYYGTPDSRADGDNEFTENLTGISPDEFRKHIPFDEDAEAQKRILDSLTAGRPFVAHNANFEINWFKANVAGFYEAYRYGRIRVIDTQWMAHQEKKAGNIPNAKLEDWAKFEGALRDDDSERHLGLEDTHIMLEGMKNKIRRDYENHTGAYDPEHPIFGIGGKVIGESEKSKLARFGLQQQ